MWRKLACHCNITMLSIGYPCKLVSCLKERILFFESLKNARIAQKSGSKRVRHSPLMIRRCIDYNHKLGKRNWATLAKTFHLPSQSTLDKHRSVGANETDGFLHEIVSGEKETLKREIAANEWDAEFEEWRRHGCLSYDSAKCRDKVIYNFHTGELMGFAHDAFDRNIIEEEWKHAVAKASAAVKDKKQSAKKALTPKLAKHFLLFYFTSWEAKAEKTQMCVARYGMDTISGTWLATEIRKIVATLDVYGFIVDSITADGASENRSCNNQLATLTVASLLTLTDEQAAKLPTDKKIAFPHPSHDGITIFIWSDMPHWTKKFVNALERTDFPDSDSNLNFNGQPLSLQMLWQVWQNEGGAAGWGLRTNKFTAEHFEKDSYSRMRVYLAVQVVSMTMCNLIDNQLSAEKLNAQLYGPLRRIIEKVDRLVDIFNGTKENKQKVPKGCENVNSPSHDHLGEVLDILALFNEWRLEAKAKNNANLFIPYTSFDDLCSMIFGLVGVAQMYLKNDCSHTMVQRHGNTDVLEHCFAHIRQRESNFDVATGRQCVAQGASKRLHGMKGNNRGAPYEGMNLNSLNEPLPKTKK